MKRKMIILLLASFLAISAAGCGIKDKDAETGTAAASLPDTEAVEIDLSMAPVLADDDDPEILESQEPEAEEIVVGSTKNP